MSTTRSLKTSGVALAGVAAIAAAAPAVVPGQIAGVPSALSISKAAYQLTALSDINFQQIAVAATTGFGGLLGPADPFYPGQFNNDVLLTGPAGAAYYIIDTADFVPLNLDRYFFEAGSLGGNPITSGLGAVAYVGAGSVFGVDSPITQAVKSIASGGGIGAGFDLSTAIVALTAGIPVVGDLASVYFTGSIPGDSTIYGTGVTGLITYATNKLLPGGLGTLFQNFDLSGLITTVTSLINGITGGNGIRPWNGEGSDESEGSDDANESESESEDDYGSAAAVAARVRAKVSTKAAAAAPAASHSATGSDSAAGKDAPEAAEAPESEAVEAPKTEASESEASESEASESEAAEAPKADTTAAADTESAAKTAPVTAKAAGAARTKRPAAAGAAAGPARRIASALRDLAPKSAQSGHVAKRGKVSRAG